jgi:cell division protein FtsB
MSTEAHAEQLEKLEFYKKIGELERENKRLKAEIERLEYALEYGTYPKRGMKP